MEVLSASLWPIVVTTTDADTRVSLDMVPVDWARGAELQQPNMAATISGIQITGRNTDSLRRFARLGAKPSGSRVDLRWLALPSSDAIQLVWLQSQAERRRV